LTSINERNARVIEEFRSNGGQLSGDRAGSDMLLLSTTGAKSGELRVNPVAYLADGDRLLVFASKGGGPTSPDWYHNLVANPLVTVEVGTETYEAGATALTGEERDRLYAKQAALRPVFAEYEQKTTRKIPVVALTRNV
jgi:deazaflavin-dependent oxidoreductase (nitroreductase family)